MVAFSMQCYRVLANFKSHKWSYMESDSKWEMDAFSIATINNVFDVVVVVPRLRW